MKLWVLIILSFSFNLYGYGDVKVPAKPGIDNNKHYDFNKEPVKYLTAIYMDHHFASLDRGLKRVDNALGIIDSLYSKNPNTRFHPKKFRHSKAFEIKATLHLLKSMILHKKGLYATSVTTKKEKEQFEKAMGKTKNSGKLQKDGLMAYAKIKGAKQQEARKRMLNYLKQSMQEMKTALKTDPKSPTIHYQYAKLLKDFYAQGESQEIEKHLYQAGKLSFNEKDSEGVSKSILALKEINSKSIFIKKLEVLK